MEDNKEKSQEEMVKEEKPSVLGKLSAAKLQEKAGAEPKAANKKKEDIQL